MDAGIDPALSKLLITYRLAEEVWLRILNTADEIDTNS